VRRQKRSRTEIIMDVLEAIASEEYVTPTRLATIANMPYDRLQPIVEELTVKGIVEAMEDGRSRRLKLTVRGLQLLQELRRLKRVLRDFGLEII